MNSDAELVNAVLRGNMDAFGDLVRRYQQVARAAAMESLHDYHAAEDAAQEAFLTAYDKLDSLRNPAVFGSWLLRIARRKALRQARRLSRTVPLLDSDCQERPSDDDERLSQRQQELLESVMKLPRSQQQVMILRYLDEHSVREVAEITGRSVGTVTKQLSRGCKALREKFGGPT